MWNKKIQKLAQTQEDGLLPSILFPSAVYYFDNNHSVVCWQCANSDKEESVFNIVDCALDYTDENGEISLCDSCGKSIDPALR